MTTLPSTISVSDMQQMAQAVAASGLFGMKKADEALALMLIAQAEGSHPAIAVRDYHIIQGKPSLKADAMLARFQSAGGRVEWKEMSDTCVSATFSHPAGGSVTIDWDMARAKAAGIGGKDMWKKFPRQMLRARVISEGIRTVFPGVVVGSYTPEEIQDFDANQKSPDVIDLSPVKDKSHSAAFKTNAEIKEWMVVAKHELESIKTDDDLERWLSKSGGLIQHLGAKQKDAMNNLVRDTKTRLAAAAHNSLENQLARADAALES